MFSSRTRTTLAAIAASAVLLTAGCGVEKANDAALQATGNPTDGPSNGPSNTPSPVEPGSFEGTGGVVRLQQAADATASMDTMSMTMLMEMNGIPGMGDVSISMEGAIDTKAERAQMTMDMGDMLGDLASVFGDDMPDDAGIMEMIVDGDTTYVRSSLYSVLPGADSSKPWFEAPSDEVSDSDTFKQGSSDPREFLDFLRNSGSEVTEVGTEEIRGVETTHLSTVLDTTKIVESAPADEREEMEESLDDLGANGITEIPVEVWVDGDGMVRKMIMTMDMSGLDTGDDSVDVSGMEVVLTMEMFDFGEPVDIEVPDASDVQKMPSSLLTDD